MENVLDCFVPRNDDGSSLRGVPKNEGTNPFRIPHLVIARNEAIHKIIGGKKYEKTIHNLLIIDTINNSLIW